MSTEATITPVPPLGVREDSAPVRAANPASADGVVVSTNMPNGAVPESSNLISKLVKAVLERKQAIFDKKDSEGRVAEDYVMIGGDVFDSGYLFLEAGMAVIPSINTLGVSILSSACGVIGGIINIRVGFICLKEANQAWANNDKKLAKRLYFNGLFIILLGIVLISASTASLAAKVGVSSSIAAFFAANPWILPVLFLVVTIPTLIEVCNRTNKIRLGEDAGSQLQLKSIETKLIKGEIIKGEKAKEILEVFKGIFNKEDYTKEASEKERFKTLRDLCKEKLTQNIAEEADRIKTLWQKILRFFQKKSDNQILLDQLLDEYKKYSPENSKVVSKIVETLFPDEKIDVEELTRKHKLSKKMEYLQAEIGVIAALQVFGLISALIEIEEDPQTELTVEAVAAQVKTAQGKIEDWNKIQYVRLVQQLSYVVASLVGFAALAPTAKVLSAVKDFILFVANAIPIYLDAFERFARNAPKIPKKVGLLDTGADKENGVKASE